MYKKTCISDHTGAKCFFVAPIFSNRFGEYCRLLTTAQSDVEYRGIARSLKNQLKGDIGHAGIGIITPEMCGVGKIRIVHICGSTNSCGKA